MIKKEYASVLIAFMAVILACSFVASDSDAFTLTEDGVEYELMEGGGAYYAEAVAYDGHSQSVVIKASVTYDGIEYPVESVAENSFNRLDYYSEAQPGTSEEDKAKRSNITSITIEGNVNLQLPPSTFKGLNNLESIEIGEGLTELPDEFIMNCSKLSSVVLPSTLERIGDYAFTKNSKLYSVDLKEVEEIGAFAFSQSGLASIVIPGSVTKIGSSAFSNCSSLANVTLEEGVEIIAASAFKGTYLTSIHMPSTVSVIGTEVFPKSLKSFTVSEDSDVFYAEDGILYTKADDHIYYYPASRTGEVTIGYDVPDSLLSGTGLTKVILLDGVTSIGQMAFSQCTGLKEVVMSDSVASIGDMAFYRCTALETVTMSKNVTQLPNNCFDGCSNLMDIDLSNLTSIGKGSMQFCSSLAMDALPDGLTSIGELAFRGCTRVTIDAIPAGVVSIEWSAFRDTGIECIVVGESDNTVTLDCSSYPVFGGSALRSVALDNVVLTDGSNASGFIDFQASSSLEKIVLGTGLTDSFISDVADAFSSVRPDKFIETVVEDGITTLSAIERIGASVVSDGLVYKVTKLEPMQCSVIGYEGSLTSITIPESVDFYGSEAQVVSIGAKAFYGCDTLVSADLGSVTSVGMKAFAHCVKLTTLDVGDSLKTISAYAFYRCLKLADINLDDSIATLKTYGSYSFYKCGKLSSMVVPSTMSTIGTKAFTMTFADENGAALEASLASLKGYEYSNVDGVLVRQAGPEIGSEFTSGKLVFRVSSALPNEVEVVGYSGKITSLDLSEDVTDGEFTYSVTAIGENAFYKCRTLTSANLGDVKVIGTKAFYGCNKLTSVEADRLVKVGIKAFAYCYALSTLDLGDSLKTICAYGFYRCESLTSFDAPYTLKTIGSYAFYKCTALGEFHSYGSSLKTIGSKAFGLCSSITYMDFPTTLKDVKSDSFDGITFKTLGLLPWLPEPEHNAAYFAGYKFTGTYTLFYRSNQPLS
ncbi:MAG: hypothetical protein E7Z68_04430 [Thermoplasmata archaeon]|jgi:hypothetical protein|nr:hypothetical protein [Thermoplasmata archaeon]